MPRTVDDLFEMAAARHGGAEAFQATLTDPKPTKDLETIPDHRWLSDMSRAVFQAGFNWSVVDRKWPGFEEVFEGFDPGRMSMMSDDDLDRYLKDARIIRHARKILSIRDNAIFLRDLAAEHGSAATAFANWPVEDFAGLLFLLKKRASRMGGTTAQYCLRRMGLESYITAGDVVRALIREGVIDKAPSSRRDFDKVQDAFNDWRARSGRPFNHISRILACSIE